MDGWRPVPVRGGVLEAEVLGSGVPVVVVQTALGADELRPLAVRVADAGFRVVHYHRRGYAGSGPALPEPSVRDDAHDCLVLLEVLGLGRAHVVGASYSGAVALEAARRAPGSVATVTTVELPPIGGPGEGDFREVSERLMRLATERGAGAALEAFMSMLVGPDWRRTSEVDLPGSVAAMERDAATFFASDVPALLGWRFDAEAAAQIRCPVLTVRGGESDVGPGAAALLAGEGDVEVATVEGAGHLLAATHPEQVAALVVGFLRRRSSAVPS